MIRSGLQAPRWVPNVTINALQSDDLLEVVENTRGEGGAR